MSPISFFYNENSYNSDISMKTAQTQQNQRKNYLFEFGARIFNEHSVSVFFQENDVIT